MGMDWVDTAAISKNEPTIKCTIEGVEYEVIEVTNIVGCRYYKRITIRKPSWEKIPANVVYGIIAAEFSCALSEVKFSKGERDSWLTMSYRLR